MLRRHGDEVERLPGGYYIALGRCDDTMNLGGIKVPPRSSLSMDMCMSKKRSVESRCCSVRGVNCYRRWQCRRTD